MKTIEYVHISRDKVLYSPVSVYFIIWIITFIIYSAKLVDYGDLSNRFGYSIALSALGLVLGWGLGVMLQPNLPLHVATSRIDSFIHSIRAGEKTIKKYCAILCLCGVMGIVLSYAVILRQIDIDGYFASQATVKSELERSVLGAYLCGCAYVALPLGGLLRWVGGLSRMYIVIPFFLCVLYSLSFWGRVPIVMALIMVISCKFLIKILLHSRDNFAGLNFLRIFSLVAKIGLAAFGMLAFLGWTIEWRVAEYGENFNPLAGLNSHDSLISSIFEDYGFLFGSFRAVQMTYAYLAASIPTLNYWVSMDSEYGLGQASFPYFARLLHKLGYIRVPEIIGDRVLGDGLQLPSLLGYAYIDFGFMGVFFFSFILAFVSSLLFYHFMHTPRISFLMYLSLIYALVLLSPQISATAWTTFPIILVGMWFVSILLRVRGISGNNERHGLE